MTDTATETARENAREDTGKFGNQDHFESGIVGDFPLSLDPDVIVDAMDCTVDEDTFPGFGEFGDNDFQRQVEEVRNGFWDAPSSAAWDAREAAGEHREFVIEFPQSSNGDTEEVMVGFLIRKSDRCLRITRAVDFSDLTDDRAAVGRPAARAIATALIRILDGAEGDYEAIR